MSEAYDSGGFVSVSYRTCILAAVTLSFSLVWQWPGSSAKFPLKALQLRSSISTKVGHQITASYPWYAG